MRYDAVIVGAGPAGAHAADLLARQGLSVALLDKHAFPREKVCGGGLSRRTLDLLGFSIDEVAHQRITGALITFGNDGALEREMHTDAGRTVVRSEFDALLVAFAERAGVRFFPESAFEAAELEDEGVRVRTNNGEFRGRYLLAADGLGSAVRKRFFGPGLVSYAPALEALVRVPDRELARFAGRVLFDFAGMPRGYGWIFPKRDHLNVGVYSVFGSRRIRRHLARFMAGFGCLRGATEVRYEGAAIPLRNRRSLFDRGRVWLLGDAAGCAESVYGEGIHFALQSARLAAQAFRQSGGAPDEGGYTQLMCRELVPELHCSERIARALFRAPRFVFRRMVENRQVSEDFAGLLLGTTSYRACLKRTLLGFPRWILSPDLSLSPALKF